MKQIKLSSLKPNRGYILVEPLEAETKTKSGIYLPETEEKPQQGKVLAVGDAALEDGQEVKSPVKKGEQVIYKKWGGNDFKIEDKEYQFLKFDDILAIVK
ncbi:MAG: co-chaperone GroES [Patescibacteria group bacterium]|nr:co-chaperone GroES [Patescibacteria group bacterium]